MTQFEKDRIKFLQLNDGLYHVNAYINAFFFALEPPDIRIPRGPAQMAVHQFIDDIFKK